MLCILLVEVQRFLPGHKHAAQEIARALCERGLFPDTTVGNVEKTLKEMERRGDQYLVLERALGKGICVVLGMQLSESQ